MTYRIAKWAQNFETAKSRSYRQLPWLALPINPGGAFMHALHDEFEERAAAAYGVWVGILQVAATMPCRGLLKDSRGHPVPIRRLARVTMFDAGDIESVITWATREGWVEIVEDESSASPSRVLDDAESGPLRNGTERNEEKKASPSLSASADVREGHDHADDVTNPPPTAPGLYEQVVESWNGCRTDRACDAWPAASKLRPKSAGNLRARRVEYDSDEAFGAALVDRLNRMAASEHYRGASGWVPSLPWLLEPSGWEKAGNLPPLGAQPKRGRVSGIDLLAREMGLEDWNEARDDCPSIRAAQ